MLCRTEEGGAAFTWSAYSGYIPWMLSRTGANSSFNKQKEAPKTVFSVLLSAIGAPTQGGVPFFVLACMAGMIFYSAEDSISLMRFS